MTDIERMKSIKSKLLDTLESLATNPKPTYSIDGQVVSWNEYFQMLVAQVKSLNDLINAEEPFEIRTQGIC